MANVDDKTFFFLLFISVEDDKDLMRSVWDRFRREERGVRVFEAFFSLLFYSLVVL